MDQQYTRRLEAIEAVLNHWLPTSPGPDCANGLWAKEVFHELSHPVDAQLMQALTAPCRDLLSRGGKRWRPLLMTLVCEALGGGDAALPLVPLVEFCHNASLIHDDIEDNSDERRGKPAVHIIHGTDVAINSGSFLYFLPLACIDSWAANCSRADADRRRAMVYSIWGAYVRRLHLGQAMDIHWHRNCSLIPSLDEYYTMCALKTGCLARFAAELGAAVAEMSTGKLGIAAEKLGVGFQILDDVKNLTTGIPGKKRGDDVAEGKKSLPVLLLLHRQPEAKDMVLRCFAAARSGGVGVPEVEALIQAMQAADILAEAEAQGKALINEAGDIFNSADIPLNDEGRGLLGGLVKLIG